MRDAIGYFFAQGIGLRDASGLRVDSFLTPLIINNFNGRVFSSRIF